MLDALEPALHDRRPQCGLTHHSDRGGLHVSIRDTERLAEVGIEPSVGSVGDSDNNALAESVIGLFKAEVIHRRRPWRGLETVEHATLEGVDWFNQSPLLGPIGHVPLAEAEATWRTSLDGLPMAAYLDQQASDKLGAAQGHGSAEAGVPSATMVGWIRMMSSVRRCLLSVRPKIVPPSSGTRVSKGIPVFPCAVLLATSPPSASV